MAKKTIVVDSPADAVEPVGDAYEVTSGGVTVTGRRKALRSLEVLRYLAVIEQETASDIDRLTAMEGLGRLILGEAEYERLLAGLRDEDGLTDIEDFGDAIRRLIEAGNPNS